MVGVDEGELRVVCNSLISFGVFRPLSLFFPPEVSELAATAGV